MLLLWRKSNDWFGLYLALVFISLCGGDATFAPLLERFPGLLGLNDFLGAASWQFFFISFFFFPTGRPEPGWARWLAVTWLGWIFIQPFTMGFWLSNMQVLVFAFPFIAIGSQIYRYFRRSNLIERQQTKWVLVAVSLIFVNILFALSSLYSPTQESRLGSSLVISIVAVALFNISIGLVPLSIAAAIFRYRLWDIDLIIRRTLVYAVLSGLLGLVYFGSVVLLRQLLGGLVGDSSIAHRPLHPADRPTLQPAAPRAPGRHRPAFLPPEVRRGPRAGRSSQIQPEMMWNWRRSPASWSRW